MNDIIKAKKIIAARRAAAEKAQEKLLSELLTDPIFTDLYQKRSYLSFELARREVYGLPTDDIKPEFDNIDRELREFLNSRGIESFEEPQYTCKKCSDTGRADGKRCECLERARIDVNLAENPVLKNLPDDLRSVDFTFYGEKKAEYEKYAKFLNNNFLRGSLNFCTLIGAAGTGKTYLAEVTTKAALNDGASVAVINAVKMNRKFLEFHCAPLERKAEVWRELTEPDVLLIDDIGVEATLNNVTIQYFYELITERYDKKTLLTANLDLRGLELKYGQRIFSRLADKRKSAIICISGEDYRIFN